MAITHEREKIILTGKTGSNFSRKMKCPDPDVIKKRDSYLNEINRTLKISQNEKGNIVLKNR